MALTLVKEKPLRRFPSWIESFLEATDGLPVPKIFLKWSAISAIAGALERKVWVRMNRMTLYPNMYVLLIGGAGIGKTVAASQTEILWRSLDDHFTAPTSVTKASLVDTIFDAKRKIIRPQDIPNYLEFNALNLMIREFGAFLPEWNNEFMNALTDFWDCQHYEERRRTGDKKLSIPNPSLNFIACATPSFMNHFMPEGAWEQGFASRLVMIFSGEEIMVDPFQAEADDEWNAMGPMYPDLQKDFKDIGSMFGKMEFTAACVEAFREWFNAGRPPVPQHRKLISYVPRRVMHLGKLLMVMAASRGSMEIDAQDFSAALDFLLEAEAFMPDIFRAMGGGRGESAAMDELWQHVYRIAGAEKKPVNEHRLVAFLSERVPSHSVLKVLETMVRAGWLKQTTGPTGMQYSPAPKEKQY